MPEQPSDGGGRDILSDALVNEEMGYHGSAALACTRTFSTHVGWVIYKFGSKELHERYLRPMLRGERVVCQGLTEPSAGSDLASLQATAKRDGDQYVVNGEKRFIDGAQTCDFIDLAVRTGESADPRQSISVIRGSASSTWATRQSGRNCVRGSALSAEGWAAPCPACAGVIWVMHIGRHFRLGLNDISPGGRVRRCRTCEYRTRGGARPKHQGAARANVHHARR